MNRVENERFRYCTSISLAYDYGYDDLCLTGDRHLDLEGGLLGKLLSPARRRRAVRHVCTELGISWTVNHKRVERIWRQEGLKVPAKQPKRGRLWLGDGSCVRRRAEYPNHVRSYDFIQDRTQTSSGPRDLLYDHRSAGARRAMAARIQLEAAAQFVGIPSAGARRDRDGCRLKGRPNHAASCTRSGTIAGGSSVFRRTSEIRTRLVLPRVRHDRVRSWRILATPFRR